MHNPYQDLEAKAFWKKAITETDPFALQSIYTKKFSIAAHDKIVTAGSCFAQHISHHLKKKGFQVLDRENSVYSANYGNIYTVKQLLQLARESISGVPLPDIAWRKGDLFFDALRPSAFPSGFSGIDQIINQRIAHLKIVREIFLDMDIFIFTLGLTEAWERRSDGVVFPSAPGVIAGSFDANQFYFRNYSIFEILSDFQEFIDLVTDLRQGSGFKVILTVSPVPLTATASGDHVLVANSSSKSILRAAAGVISLKETIDYFPSYEIVMNPRYGYSSFDSNLRTVAKSTVENVMSYFFAQHVVGDSRGFDVGEMNDIQCEDQLLEMYSGISSKTLLNHNLDSVVGYTEVVGNSHLNSFVKALESHLDSGFVERFCVVDHRVLGNGLRLSTQIQEVDIFESTSKPISSRSSKFAKFSTVALSQLKRFKGRCRDSLIVVGGVMGDNFLRLHGSFDVVSSPEIPVVDHVDQISPLFVNLVIKRLTYVSRQIDEALTSLAPSRFRWIASPLPSESSAQIRFGKGYVDSRSQHVYNQLFNDLAAKFLGGHIESGLLVMQPASTITASGFSSDDYAHSIGTMDIHLSKDYYSILLPMLEPVIGS